MDFGGDVLSRVEEVSLILSVVGVSGVGVKMEESCAGETRGCVTVGGDFS